MYYRRKGLFTAKPLKRGARGAHHGQLATVCEDPKERVNKMNEEMKDYAVEGIDVSTADITAAEERENTPVLARVVGRGEVPTDVKLEGRGYNALFKAMKTSGEKVDFFGGKRPRHVSFRRARFDGRRVENKIDAEVVMAATGFAITAEIGGEWVTFEEIARPFGWVLPASVPLAAAKKIRDVLFRLYVKGETPAQVWETKESRKAAQERLARDNEALLKRVAELEAMLASK